MENQPQTLEDVQTHIERLSAEILLKQMEIERYERIGHAIVENMYGIPTQREGNNG